MINELSVHQPDFNKHSSNNYTHSTSSYSKRSELQVHQLDTSKDENQQNLLYGYTTNNVSSNQSNPNYFPKLGKELNIAIIRDLENDIQTEDYDYSSKIDENSIKLVQVSIHKLLWYIESVIDHILLIKGTSKNIASHNTVLNSRVEPARSIFDLQSQIDCSSIASACEMAFLNSSLILNKQKLLAKSKETDKSNSYYEREIYEEDTDCSDDEKDSESKLKLSKKNIEFMGDLHFKIHKEFLNKLLNHYSQAYNYNRYHQIKQTNYHDS